MGKYGLARRGAGHPLNQVGLVLPGVPKRPLRMNRDRGRSRHLASWWGLGRDGGGHGRGVTGRTVVVDEAYRVTTVVIMILWTLTVIYIDENTGIQFIMSDSIVCFIFTIFVLLI